MIQFWISGLMTNFRFKTEVTQNMYKARHGRSKDAAADQSEASFSIPNRGSVSDALKTLLPTNQKPSSISDRGSASLLWKHAMYDYSKKTKG